MDTKISFLGLQLDNFSDLKRWADQLTSHPAVIRAYERGRRDKFHTNRNQGINEVFIRFRDLSSSRIVPDT